MLRERLVNFLFKNVILDEVLVKKLIDTGGDDGTAYFDAVKFTGKTSDPTLEAGLMWFRSNLNRVRYTGDGSTVISLDPDP